MNHMFRLCTKEKGSGLSHCPGSCSGMLARNRVWSTRALVLRKHPQTYSSAFFSFFMGLEATAISMNTIATTAKIASSTNELK